MERKKLPRIGIAVGAFRDRLVNPYRFALFALIAGHFVFLMLYFEPAISGPDANGYFAQVQLIANHGRTWLKPESPLQYVGVHWLKTEEGRYFSRYPPGLPIILAIPYKLLGPRAALLMNPILTSLTLLGLFMICSLWIGEPWALAATMVMAVNPVVNDRVFSGDSHSATAFFLIWGLYLLARWARTRSLVLAFLAGLLFGIIPTVRYAEVLFCLGLGLFMATHLNRDRRTLKSLGAASMGALIPIMCLMIHNQMAFGAFWRTGYSLTKEQTAFSWEYFAQNAVPYLQSIQSDGLGIFAAFGLVGMVALCTRRDTCRRGILLLSLVLPTTLLYMSYYFAPVRHATPAMRFLLPTFYVYAIAGVWCLRMVAENWSRSAWVAALAALLFTICWGTPQSLRTVARWRDANSTLASVTRVVAEHVEPESIVIASPQIQQHLDFVGIWRLIDESTLRSQPETRTFAVQRNSLDEPSPMAFQLREKRETMQRYRDGTKLLEDLNDWAQPTREAYWVGNLEDMKQLVPASDTLDIAAKIELPHTENRQIEPGQPFAGMPGFPVPDGAGFRGNMRPDFVQGRMGRGGFIGGDRGIMQDLRSDGDLVLAKWTWSPRYFMEDGNEEEGLLKQNPDQLSLIEQMKARRKRELRQE